MPAPKPKRWVNPESVAVGLDNVVIVLGADGEVFVYSDGSWAELPPVPFSTAAEQREKET